MRATINIPKCQNDISSASLIQIPMLKKYNVYDLQQKSYKQSLYVLKKVRFLAKKIISDFWPEQFIIIFYLSKMYSEESSVRDMFQYPNNEHELKHGKNNIKGYRNKRYNNDPERTQKWSFDKLVRVIKNVADFSQKIKNKRAEKGSVIEHTLKPQELQYLQSDSQIESQKALFCHDSRFILIIDILFIGAMLLYFWQCTYELVLGEIDKNETINSMALGFYFLHILLQQVTQFKNQKSQLITNLVQIRQIYIKEKIIKDLISITVLTLQLTPLDNIMNNFIFFIIIRLLSLVSYVEMSTTCEKVQDEITISIFGQTFISLLKLVYKLLLFLHSISIVLNLVVTLENYYGLHNTWLSNPNISYNSQFEKYILGWYWGATILSTVGFGDIIPYNNIQRFIVSLIQVCCCMSFGYFVNAVGQMIKVRSQSSEKYMKEVRSLNRFLSMLTISNDLKHKIRTHYFNKNLVESMHDPKEEKEVLQTITPNLKTSLLQEINLKLIKQCFQFQRFRSQTINNIAQSLKRIVLAPECVLYSRNTTERKIWFIQSGNVQEFTDNFSNSKLRKLVSLYDEKQPLVGWINFITPNSYKTMAKAKNFTVAHQLSQVQFLKHIGQDTRDFLKFAEMKQIILQKSRRFDSKCISCGKYTHNVINCSRIHFVKKQGYKLVQHKKLLDGYIQAQAPKAKRLSVKYSWKKLFGTGQLQKEANLLINNSLSIQKGKIENILKKLAHRESLFGLERRKTSFLVVNREKQLDRSKIIDFDQISRPSMENDQEQQEEYFQKVFFNKENSYYFPNCDVEKVIGDYRLKFLKKRKEEQRIKTVYSHKG